MRRLYRIKIKCNTDISLTATQRLMFRILAVVKVCFLLKEWTDNADTYINIPITSPFDIDSLLKVLA